MMEKYALVATKSEWVVDLKCAFQDEEYIYLVMEYMATDLFSLLESKKLTEEEIKFYVAEIILAVELINKKGFMHRDLKPENIYSHNLGT